MISSDFRAEARKKLEGKWGKVALITLAYFVIFFLINFVESFFPDSTDFLFSIINTIIEIPLALGLIFSLFKVYNDEDVKAFDFLELGFNNFKKSWGITFEVFKKMILPIILVIISYILIFVGISLSAYSIAMYSCGSIPNSNLNIVFILLTLLGFILLIISMIWTITKSFYYQLAYLIAVDNPDMTSKNAVLKSEELMTGNRSKLFWLQLSFIGWAILSAFTFGIGMLWLAPYMQFAIIAFYKYISGNNQNIEAKVVTDDTDNPIQ